MGTSNSFKTFKEVAGQDFKLKEKLLSTTAMASKQLSQFKSKDFFRLLYCLTKN